MPRLKQFDKQEVLQKAIDIFWKKGYHATSIQDLVDALGINRASLYNTFGGKKQLYNAALSHYQQSAFSQLQAFLNEKTTARQAIADLFQLAVDGSVEDTERKGCFVVNATCELCDDDTTTQSTIAHNKRVNEELYYKLLKAGQQRGEIAPDKDIKAIAAFIYTLFNGLRVVAKVDNSRQRLTAITQTALQVLDQ